ncbi:MAG: GGDEF domain-containing protein [Gammaproteobacteria bacterium]|nr:GGDEF domain-containing protein [Gammaproteobacteria bacterium]
MPPNPLARLAQRLRPAHATDSTVPGATTLRQDQAVFVTVICLTLGMYAVLEPWLDRDIHRTWGWLTFSALSALGMFASAALTARGHLALTRFYVPLLLGLFAAGQLYHHTGLSWMFLLPPVVLFLHPFRRGVLFLLLLMALAALGLLLVHTRIELRDQEPIEFVASFVLLVIACGVMMHELSKALAHMASIAHHDTLTGLYRKALFFELAEYQLHVAARYRSNFTLLVLDLDNFKSVNDRLGHAAGDRILTAAAQTLRENLRGSDVAARFGGDEFVVLLPLTSAAGARILAERIAAGIKASLAREAPGLTELSVSIGIAEYPAHGAAIRELFDAADRALLHGKARGKNQIALAG